ncbi:MAG: aminopeptidase P family protein [Acidobacteriaceae bacterium]|nr:aminopeptidase P family protein [Acidobacteriaceae bacterium]
MDKERAERLKTALSENNLDAIVCALPKHVLLLSGYWPVVGTSIAVALRDRPTHVIVPEDEKELAQGSGCVVHTYRPASLNRLITPAEAIVDPLKTLNSIPATARIGVEGGDESEPASYAAMHLFGTALPDSLRVAFPSASIQPIRDLLSSLRAVKTTLEVEHIRVACDIARFGFEGGAGLLRPGLTEIMAAQIFRDRMKRERAECPEVQREENFVWVMSGLNSAKAHGAYARSRTKIIESGDLVLVHCNLSAEGYWTDITRTYSLGSPDKERRSMYDAVFEARTMALNCIAPGRKAADVDEAARSVLERRGFGKAFKHSTGHGVGFEAISPNALPRLHPKSPDVLQAGMVCNIEPAIYIDGYGGIRHCDMVAVTEHGYELLTPFQTTVQDLILSAGGVSSNSA